MKSLDVDYAVNTEFRSFWTVYDALKAETHFKNALSLKWGGELHVKPFLDAHLGAFLRESPVTTSSLGPIFPLVKSAGFSLGAGLRVSRFQIDVAYVFAPRARLTDINDWCLGWGDNAQTYPGRVDHTGIAWQAFNYMRLHGVTTEQYVSCDFRFPVCNYPAYPDTFCLHDNWILGMWDKPLNERVRTVKYILQRFGPVAGGFMVFEDWARYREGVYLYDNVSPFGGHHSIEIVGWGDDAALPNGGYWIVKNDFGEAWGENGFFRIGYGECEIDMTVMFAAWNPDTKDPVFALKAGTRYYSAGESISLRLFARVPEGHTPAYRAEGLPRGASYNETTGLFTWTPGRDEIGEHEIWFTAWYDSFETAQKGTFIVLPARKP